jgi:hypothetical protein
VSLFGNGQFYDCVRYVDTDDRTVVDLSRKARRDVAGSAPDVEYRHGAPEMRQEKRSGVLCRPPSMAAKNRLVMAV